MQRIVIFGLGFMGRVHLDAYRRNPAAKVVGIVDLDPASTRAYVEEQGLEIRVADSLEAILQECEADAVDICLPTDLHRSLAEAAFARGLHVFCEKPIALSSEDAEAIIAAGKRAGRQLMVGHCIRFWPEYCQLKEAVTSRVWGDLRVLSLQRRAPRPTYATGGWIDDPARCAGAALDLHIHDSDFVLHLLGSPSAVFSRGVRLPSGWDYLSTDYVYENVSVHAEGGWICPPDWNFRMGYVAIFEHGTLEFDSAAPVAEQNSDSKSAYEAELDYFVECLERGTPVAINTGEDAARSLRLVLAEIESAHSGSLVNFSPAS